MYHPCYVFHRCKQWLVNCLRAELESVLKKRSALPIRQLSPVFKSLQGQPVSELDVEDPS